jgi:predicted CoA-binding protein
MAPPTASLDTIQDFLAQQRIAIVGASRDPKSFSAMLLKEFSDRGYDVVPVNPKTPNVLGRTCYARVQDIRPAVEGALLVISAQATESLVVECAKAGVPRIWIYGANGKSSVSAKAMEFCRERGVEVIAGQCPFMFLPGSGGVHRFHGFVRKITGRYPQRNAA